jgi:hypothetical protein
LGGPARDDFFRGRQSEIKSLYSLQKTGYLYLDFLSCFIIVLEFPAWEPLQGRMGRKAHKARERNTAGMEPGDCDCLEGGVNSSVKCCTLAETLLYLVLDLVLQGL